MKTGEYLKAIILSAGQGRRLLPLTADLPKCLLNLGGRTVLEWQLLGLRAAGIKQVTVVTGFGADKVAAVLARRCPAGMKARSLFNPMYAVADNLVSCLAARDDMHNDFLLVNGDTLFEMQIVTRLLHNAIAPVSVAVAHKDAYDADDMKVRCIDGWVRDIGKDLHHVDGEAIGISLYRGDGPKLFRDALDEVAHQPDAHRRWYLSAVNLLAHRGRVHAVPIGTAPWAEIDYPHDLKRAAALVSSGEEDRHWADAPLTMAAAD